MSGSVSLYSYFSACFPRFIEGCWLAPEIQFVALPLRSRQTSFTEDRDSDLELDPPLDLCDSILREDCLSPWLLRLEALELRLEIVPSTSIFSCMTILTVCLNCFSCSCCWKSLFFFPPRIADTARIEVTSCNKRFCIADIFSGMLLDKTESVLIRDSFKPPTNMIGIIFTSESVPMGPITSCVSNSIRMQSRASGQNTHLLVGVIPPLTSSNSPTI
mmetsp:Transcript_20761/g.33858  ORF Transcript_20761/g.33858 Transcript_20761/m.33858 type:complete len:217 (-) Transcript_20761:1668-2318(-)